jgi:hypothetical protein
MSREQVRFATRIAHAEIRAERSRVRVALADLRHGFARQTNTGHQCRSGTLLRVVPIGSFPHTTVAPLPGQGAAVHAEIIDADPTTGRVCRIGVRTGHVQAPAGGTRLPLAR